MIGLWTTLRTALDPHRERHARADAALLLGWIITVVIAGGLKPSQYQRYLMPALPAIAVVTAAVIVQMLKNRIPAWLSGGVAVFSVAGALILAYFPVANGAGSSQKYLAMAEVINHRFSPDAPVPILTLRTNSDNHAFLLTGETGKCRFFFGREAQALTIADAKEEIRHGHQIIIVPARSYKNLANELHLATLMETDDWVLAESGAI